TRQGRRRPGPPRRTDRCFRRPARPPKRVSAACSSLPSCPLVSLLVLVTTGLTHPFPKTCHPAGSAADPYTPLTSLYFRADYVRGRRGRSLRQGRRPRRRRGLSAAGACV